ncbi:MAG: putative endonuclease [Bacteroidia bacterium]|jgi:putative endonuclease
MINKRRFFQVAPPPKAQSTQQRGTDAEEQAAQWLSAQGLKINARNFYTRCGEIDIIARDGEHLVFIEVRLRKSNRFGSAAATVDSRKQRKLILTAQYYLHTHHHGQNSPPCRFDVVALTPHNTGLTINWHKPALVQDDTNYNAY